MQSEEGCPAEAADFIPLLFTLVNSTGASASHQGFRDNARRRQRLSGLYAVKHPDGNDTTTFFMALLQ
jgi:hypothetical protein